MKVYIGTGTCDLNGISKHDNITFFSITRLLEGIQYYVLVKSSIS